MILPVLLGVILGVMACVLVLVARGARRRRDHDEQLRPRPPDHDAERPTG